MVTLEHYEGFTDSKKLVYLEENKPIFKQLKNIDYDLALVFANGRQVDKYYTPKENDLLVIRSVAGSLTTAGLIISGVSLVVGVVAGVSAYKSNQQVKQLEKELTSANSNDRNIVKLPYLRGASNTLATGKTQPYVIGTHLFTPYILNSGKNENYKGFTTIDGVDGDKSFYNIVLEGGFNNQIIKKVFADDTELVTLDGSTPQNKDYSLNNSGLFNSPNNFIEIIQDGTGFKRFPDMNKVIVEKKLNAIMNKKPSDATKDGTDTDKYKDLIYSLEANTMSADVVILINGLCHFDAEGLRKPSSRNVILKYSPNYNELLAKGDDNALTNANWYDFDEFEQITNVVDTNTSYREAVYKQTVSRIYNLSDDKIKKLVKESSHYSWQYVSGDSDVSLRNNADSYVYEITGYTKSGVNRYWEVTIKAYKETKTEETVTTTYSNSFSRNTLSQLRFKAHKDFTKTDVKASSYPIAIKLSSNDRESAEGQDYNDVYLDLIHSYIYDEDELNDNDVLTNAKVIDSKSASLSTLIGLHIEATELNEEKLKSIQVITSGVAKTWDGSQWSPNKYETSNPASWLLEVLTSDKHSPSKVELDEIDLDSFGEWYTDCENKGLTVDYVITSGLTKQSIFELICNAGRGVMYRNIYGKIAVAIDNEKTNAQGILNEQNLVSFEYKKEIKREPDGINIEYIDADAGYQKNNFIVMYNSTDSSGNYDPYGKNRSADSIIQSVKIEGVTTWDNAIKHARYLMKCQRLRPKTCTAVVGHEGIYYVPMTKFLVQHPSLKIGLGNAEIESVIYNENNTHITGLKLFDAITLDSTNTFNVVIQCVGINNGVEYCTPLSAEINKYNGRTKEITFKVPISLASSSVIPHANDVLSYGYGVETVTSPMLLTGIENNGNGYNLTLVDYNASIFDDSEEIPDYTPNITQPQKPVNETPRLTTEADLLAKFGKLSEDVNDVSIPVTVKLYKRATSRPLTTGITSQAEFNYNTNTLTWKTEGGNNGWTTTEPDGTDPCYITGASISGRGKYTIEPNTWVTPVLYVKNGNDGINSADIYNVVPNFSIVTRYSNGQLSSDKIKFNFYKSTQSVRGEVSVYYEIFVNESVGVWTKLTQGTGLNVEIDVNQYMGLRCDIYADQDATVLLDTQTVPVVSEGAGAISVALSNSNVSIPCDSNGNPKTLDGTNTLVYVLCGATPLNYGDASITGNFNVEVEYENVNVQTRSRSLDVIEDYKDELEDEYIDEDGNIYQAVSYFELPNITEITSDKGTRKVTVKGTSYDNKNFEITTNQLFSKVESGADGLNGRDGVDGVDGQNGADGKDGTSVYLVSLQYAVSNNIETVPTEWSDVRPTVVTQGGYIWTRRIYHDDKTSKDYAEYSYTYEAKDGKSIENVVEYYLITNASSGVTRDTSGWTQTVQIPTKTKKYLWNYEKIVVQNGADILTDPVIIGNFATDGEDGNGVSSVTEYYATSTTKTQPANITETNFNNLVFDSTNKYLWNKTVTKYTKSADKTTVKIIGVYGDSGTNGYNITTVVLYQRKKDTPAKPTADLTYKFAKPPVITWGTTGKSNGWQYDKPEITSEKLPLWEIRSTALSNTATDIIKPSDWGKVEITQLDNGLTEAEVEALLNTTEENIFNALVPTYDIEVDGTTFVTNEYGVITKQQTITCKLYCMRNGIDIPFKVMSVEVPDGFIYSQYEDTVTFTSLVGSVVGAGKFSINIKSVDMSFLNYSDEDEEDYLDENDESYAQVSFNVNEVANHTFDVFYNVLAGGQYLDCISSISSIPSKVVIGDYFTWTGETVETKLSLQGQFRTASVYTWDGTYWGEELNGEHLSRTLSDVLGIVDADLQKNNSKAYEYLDHLTANEIFAGKVIAKLVEADLFVGKEVYAEKMEVIGNDLTYLSEMDETIVNSLSDTSKGKTIITGGKIKTDLLKVAEITAGLAKIADLTSGTITVKNATNATKANSADSATNATNAQNATNSTNATNAKNVNNGSLGRMNTGSGNSIAIHSDDWEDENSTTGFGILANGDAYFNKGTFRGNIYGKTGRFEAGLGFITNLPVNQGGGLSYAYNVKNSISLLFIFKESSNTSKLYGGLLISRAGTYKGTPTATPIGSLNPNFSYSTNTGNIIGLTITGEYLQSGESYRAVELIIS